MTGEQHRMRQVEAWGYDRSVIRMGTMMVSVVSCGLQQPMDPRISIDEEMKTVS
jgi:hypothetical protein